MVQGGKRARTRRAHLDRLVEQRIARKLLHPNHLANLRQRARSHNVWLSYPRMAIATVKSLALLPSLMCPVLTQ